MKRDSQKELGLLQPNLYCYSVVSPSLAKGDFLYFDKAIDRGEFTVIKDYLLRDIGPELVGATHAAVAFRILKKSILCHQSK